MRKTERNFWVFRLDVQLFSKKVNLITIGLVKKRDVTIGLGQGHQQKRERRRTVKQTEPSEKT